MLSEPNNHNVIKSNINNKTYIDSLNINLKMCISQSNNIADNLLVNTGIKIGKKNQYCDEDLNNSFYNSNNKDILQILNNIEKNLLIKTNETKIFNPLITKTYDLNSEAVSKKSIETQLIDTNSNLKLFNNLERSENNLLDSDIDSNSLKLQKNNSNSILTKTNNNDKTNDLFNSKRLESNDNSLENKSNNLKRLSSYKLKSCLKDKNIDNAMLPPLPNLNKTKLSIILKLKYNFILTKI